MKLEESGTPRSNMCVCETRVLRGGCIDVRVTELHYSRSHTCRKILMGETI